MSFFYAKLKISLLPCHVAKNCALSPQIIKEKQNTLDKCLSKYLGANKKKIILVSKNRNFVGTINLRNAVVSKVVRM